MKTINENKSAHLAVAEIPTITSRLATTDRCDACGHRAYIHVELTMGEFTFCGHHGKHLRAAMQPYLLNFDDQTDTIESRKY